MLGYHSDDNEEFCVLGYIAVLSGEKSTSGKTCRLLDTGYLLG
jgi:hypothetical protein